MAKFEDPVTGTSYDPIGDPAGTAMKFVYVVGGLTMTLLALGVAQGNVLPRLKGLINDFLGVNAGGDTVTVEY